VSVSAADANRNFSALLRGVRKGQSVVITSHGREVARIIPFEHEADAGGVTDALLARLAAEPVVDVGRWTRDSLYEDRE